jgi:subtilase family serine protease
VWARAADDRQLIPIHLPAAVTNSPSIGLLPGLTNLSLAIGLPLRDRGVLTNLLREIYDPASTNFRHFLKLKQ